MKPSTPVTETYKSRRAEASAERRRRVLRAANACFCHHGYQKASVEQIALEAGVSKALVFTFFGSKEVLFRAVIGETMHEWQKFSEQEAAQYTHDPRQELRHLFTGSFDFVERHPMLWTMLHYSDSKWLEVWPELVELNRAWQKRLAQVLRRGIGKGMFRADLHVKRNAEVIHELQRAMLARLFDQSCATRPDALLIETAAEMIINGLRSLDKIKSP